VSENRNKNFALHLQNHLAEGNLTTDFKKNMSGNFQFQIRDKNDLRIRKISPRPLFKNFKYPTCSCNKRSYQSIKAVRLLLDRAKINFRLKILYTGLGSLNV
jgi:hypothetical protein